MSTRASGAGRGKEAPFCGPEAGRRRLALPPGPLFSCKTALCGGCGPQLPLPAVEEGAGGGPGGTAPPWLLPIARGHVPSRDLCLLGDKPAPRCAPATPSLERLGMGTAQCPCGAQGQLDSPVGHNFLPLSGTGVVWCHPWAQGSVSPSGMETVQCPHQAQLCVPTEDRDSSMSPLVIGTAQCPRWAQLCAPFGYRSALVSPLGMGTALCLIGQSSVSPWGMGTAQRPCWAQLPATVRHRDGSMPPLGTETAQCPS